MNFLELPVCDALTDRICHAHTCDFTEAIWSDTYHLIHLFGSYYLVGRLFMALGYDALHVPGLLKRAYFK